MTAINETQLSVGQTRDAIWLKACWGVFGLWFAFTLWGYLLTGSAGPPPMASLVLIVLFVAIHGYVSYGWRGAAAYMLIAGVVSMTTEITSVNFGFPFGFYTHDRPGLKLLGVPWTIPFAYLTLGWPAWIVARLIVRDRPTEAGGATRFITPVVAAFILTFHNFSSDPIGATIGHAYTYRHPGGYFGSPLTNYLGWLFTGWLFFQLFALIESRFTSPHRAALSKVGYWIIPCLITATDLLRYPIKFATAPAGLAVVEGRSFVIADIYESGIISSLLTLGFVVILAAVRIWSGKATIDAAVSRLSS